VSGAGSKKGTAREEFLRGEAGCLGPFDYLVVSAAAPPRDAARLIREGDGSWNVGVWNRTDPPLSSPQRSRLAALGFKEGAEEWRVDVPPADQAAATAVFFQVLAEVCGVGADDPIDLKHDSSRAESEAADAIRALKAQIAPWLEARTGSPARVDDDGDFVLDLERARLYVSPQCSPGRSPIVQVFAITNLGLAVSDAVGGFLSVLNFELVFGRFSLDLEHGSVWLTENLLGRHLTDDDFWEIVEALAETVARYDERIARRFGGTTAWAARAEAPEHLPESPNKPGQGGYL
jgi:hypothetical protein